MHAPDLTRSSASPRYAAVELGSDSFRLHVARVEDGELRLEASLAEPVRLAASFDGDGSLCEAAMRRALACLRAFADTLALWRPQAVRVVATSALRMARNAPVFLQAAEGVLRRPVEPLAADEAGRLVYLGVASTLPPGDEARLVLDIGGASTELVRGCGDRVDGVESIPVGAVRQSLSFFADGVLDAAAFDAAVRSGRSRFAETALAGRPPSGCAVYGACGTVRALAEIAREDGLGDGRLDRACLLELRRRFLQAGHVARIRLAWPAAARAPHLAGGLALLLALIEEGGIERVVPVQAGLRVGALWELHSRGAGYRPFAGWALPAHASGARTHRSDASVG